MLRIWNYLVNTFLNVTKGSFKRMSSICNHHLAALEAEISDTDILALFNATKIVVDDFNSKFSKWRAAKGTLMGETFRFLRCLNELSNKIPQWDMAVQQVFLEKTPDYKVIFSHGRTGFYSGTYEQRISELESFQLQLAKYPLLSAVLTDAENYTNTLKGYRNVQQQKSEQLSSASKELEKSRTTVGQKMYGNLGMLMYKNAVNPEVISKFFNLSLLRKHNGNENDENTNYTKSIPPGAQVEAGIAFGETTEFLLFNNSNATLGVYAAPVNPSDPPAQMQTIEPDEEKIVKPIDLGEPGSRFLFIVNSDLHDEGVMEITQIQ